DEVISIREFDSLTQRSISRVKTIRISAAMEHAESNENKPFLTSLQDWFGREVQIVWVEPDLILEEITKHDAGLIGSAGREILSGDPPILWDIIEESNVDSDRHFSLPFVPVPEFRGDYRAMAIEFRKWTDQGYRINLVYHRESVRRVVTERLSMADLDIEDPDIWDQRRSTVIRETSEIGPNYITGVLSRGFRVPDAKIVFVTEGDIVGKKQRQPWRKSDDLQDGLSFQDLGPGDLVVHIDHGIGRYDGLKRLNVNGKDRDFLLLRYANDQKLYLPVDRLHLIQRYMAARDAHPALDKMGGVAFTKRKKKVRESVLKLAAELLKLFSQREVVNGFAFPPDDAWQREFELGFEYEETPDQLKAINQVKSDMESSSPMDRIVCGDVGYGKTEVAMRAAFKAAVGGRQVAVLVPTTILAQQHFRSFQNRFSRFPIKTAMLSRFLNARDKKAVLKELASGNVDIVIGTHALLSETVVFANLGLVIIDEEQRFGVKHKEKLKQMRTRVDVLTLTATPIPRTLNMSLLGLREISLINTPPESRRPIKTHITKFDRKCIRKAILQEIDRGGQIYFVHNRVQSIHAMLEMLQVLVPEASFGVGHGQMAESKLEKIMLQFLEKEFDVLLCTTIIESGLDIPSVNTIIINRADQLGLAQLYQLRGRVGRAQHQAYAWLMVPASDIVSEKAKDRLTAIREAVELGSGFKLATRDLDIRGAGDILGANQHGQISAVGFDMYCQMIREAVQELKGVQIEDVPECEIKLPYDLAIPDNYIEEPSLRLEVYRRFSTIKDIEQIDLLMVNLKDRFGDPPSEIHVLAELAGVRVATRQLALTILEYKNGALSVSFHNNTLLKPEKIMGLLMKSPQKYQFNPPGTLYVRIKSSGGAELVRKARYELETLVQMF
ncbi:transcription-repair coupling factor, partial [bacterium]|nr:transcription-repair coupling factor [bacterium]